MIPSNTLKVTDFPAPLGPRRPNTSPLLISKSIFLSKKC